MKTMKELLAPSPQPRLEFVPPQYKSAALIASVGKVSYNVTINLCTHLFPGSEADRSPPTSAEVKKMWVCTSTPP
jgi:hypothetical protein